MKYHYRKSNLKEIKPKRQFSIKQQLKEAYSNPIVLLATIATAIFLFSAFVALQFFFNSKRELLVQIVAESFGIVLDIGVLGILMIWITSINERKRKIEEAKNEIDDYRYWGLDRPGEEEYGKHRFLETSLETSELTLRKWQINYAAIKIVRNIKTLAGYGINAIDLNHCQCPSSNLTGIKLVGSNLDNSNFSGCSATGVNLSEVTACSANFSNTDLSFAKIRKSSINGSSFKNAVLLETDCCYSKFLNTSFENAKLHTVAFVGANFMATDFTNAELVKVNFSLCTGLTAKQLLKARRILNCIIPQEIENELKKLKEAGTTFQLEKQHIEQKKAG